MKMSFLILLFYTVTLIAVDVVYGRDAAFAIGFGMSGCMALVIAATFFWLWRRRATPLALGMGFTKAGGGLILIWFAAYRLLERPSAMFDSAAIFLFIALYFVGAAHHFAVMQRTMQVSFLAFVLPVLAAALAGVMLVL